VGSVAGEIPTPFNGIYCASKAALHAVVETLSMELAPFGVSATLVIPGSVKSNISTNHSKDFLLPPNSLYKHYLDKIVARMFLSQGKGSMATDAFADHVVGQIMKGEQKSGVNGPLFVRAGQWAWRMWLLGWLPRTWVLRFMSWRIMGNPKR